MNHAPTTMKVLLIHASLGAGHKRAAQALQEGLQQKQIATEIQDLLDFLPARMSRIYIRSYSFMINHARWLWHLTYELLDKPHSPYRPAQSILQKWQFKLLKDYVQRNGFTHILSTHFTPAALFTDWKEERQIEAKIFSVVTDYSAHRCWKRTGLDHYFVATTRVSEQLQKSGITAGKITVSGIPISPAFSTPPDRNQARAEWGCEPEDSLILILCSGFNLDKTLRLLREVRGLQGAFRFLVSTGSDPAKEQNVRKQFEEDPRFTIFGLSPRISEMMAGADLMVSKPGGLIVSEALAMGLPQVLLSPIPGQEEANANYAEQSGAAICLKETEGAIRNALTELLANRRKLTSMAEAARSVGKPRAAFTIIDGILGH